MSTQGHLPDIHRPLQTMHYVPHNMQEFEDDMRVIVNRHMGFGGGNPSQWVVNAVIEAFQRGVAIGQRMSEPRSPEQQRETQWAQRIDPEQKAIGGPRAIEQATRPDVARLGGPSDIIDV